MDGIERRISLDILVAKMVESKKGCKVVHGLVKMMAQKEPEEKQR